MEVSSRRWMRVSSQWAALATEGMTFEPPTMMDVRPGEQEEVKETRS